MLVSDFSPFPSQIERADPEKPVVKGTAAITNDGAVALKLKNPAGKVYEVFGFAKEVPSTGVAAASATQNFFVTSRGGEYFFIPSISTIASWAH